MSPRRTPCTLIELEALRAAMFHACRLGDRLEREANYLGAAMLWGYAIELAQLLAGADGLQGRLFYWQRQAVPWNWRREAPPWKVGDRSRRLPRRRRKPSKSRRRTRAVCIPGTSATW